MLAKDRTVFSCRKEYEHYLFAGVLLLIVWIIFYYNANDINLKIAYGGFGPHHYVAQKLHPENFDRDWPIGILTYDYSFPMRVYYLAKYCGISPSVTVYPFMFFQTLLFLLSVAFLTQTLFNNKFLTYISVIVISVSNLAGLNLSRFATGYGSYLSLPLFYAYANTFRLFAIGFFLKNKYILCCIFLALSVYSHLNMGLFAVVFIGAYLLYSLRLFRDRSVLIGILVFLALVGPFIYSIVFNASISSGGIPVEQWVKSTRIFSSHWYPITLKLFTENAAERFFPFLLLCFFFFVALRYHDIKNEKNMKIFVGSVVCLIMSLLGIIVSDIYPIPFLIKISFQRSTGLITLLGVLYLIYYLFRKMESSSIFTVFFAVYSLLVFGFSKPGIAVLPLFLLLYSDIKEGHFGVIKIVSNKVKIVKMFYYTAAFLLFLLTFISIFQDTSKVAHSIFSHLWAPLQYFSPCYGFDFLVRGGSFKLYSIFTHLLIGTVLITCAMMTLKVAKNKALTILFISIFFLMSVSTVWYLERAQYLRWSKKRYKIASSYLDVQLWAKNNTPHDALFMPDPAHSYGWRDFSERSSFGNLREWGYCAIAYNPDNKVYQEGIERMKEFGIDIKETTEEDLDKSNSIIYKRKLTKDIRLSYYNMSVNRLEKLCKGYSIDYFIMNKKYLNPSHLLNLVEKFRIAYMNNHFLVFTHG